MKNLKYKSVLLILIVSGSISILTNYVNPKGIPLIREKVELSWAEDSVLIESQNPIIDSSKIIEDEFKNTIEEKNETILEVKSSGNELEGKVQAPHDKMQTEDKKIEKEVLAFKEPKAITLQQALNLHKNGVAFIDARESVDFEQGHIKDAINIPYYEFEENEHKLESLNKNEPIVTYCSGTDCDLSILLGNELHSMGFKQVYIFFGGWPEWINGNHPVTLKTEEPN